jgi:hypothetical protein
MIEECIYTLGFSEKQTFIALRRDGYVISKRGLQSIRKEKGWIRRLGDEGERLKLLERAEQALLSISEESNALSGYGRRTLQPYLRTKTGLAVPRDRLFELYRHMFPGEIDQRRQQLRRKKGQFLIPGPNYQWCIDGHDKLKAFGFEIYAAIDAHTRYIIWLYVGHSNATAVGVLAQYLNAVARYEIRPWFIQSDLGSETPLAAGAHWWLVHATNGVVEWKGKVSVQGPTLKECYKAAPSTQNVKIEKMWESMLHSSSRPYVHFFGELARDGEFDREDEAHQIALYGVYELRVRGELKDFVHMWNTHPIRLQRNRPHVIHGNPSYTWKYPDPKKGCNWGIPVSPEVLAEIANPLADVELGACLPEETREWCDRELAAMGIQDVKLNRESDKLRPFKQFYLALRDKVIAHMASGRAPVLRYLQKPTGGIELYVCVPYPLSLALY